MCGWIAVNTGDTLEYIPYYCSIDDCKCDNPTLMTTIKIQFDCECGAEKLGYNNHSQWCPKHE